MIIINVAYPRFASVSISFFLSLSRFTFALVVVHALPAVPLICRFVCAFKHDSPNGGATRGDERKERAGRGKKGARKKLRG